MVRSVRSPQSNFACVVLVILYVVVASSYAAQLQELLLGVTLNQGTLTDAGIFLRDDAGRVWAMGADLQQWRLKLPSVDPIQHQGDAYYPLDTMGATYKIDDIKQTITIDIPASAFLPSKNQAQRETDSPIPIPSTFGAFFNYDGVVLNNQNQTRFDTLTEFGVFNSWGVGTTTILGRDLGNSTPNTNDTSQFLRLDSTWTSDMPDTLATLRLGDSISQANTWGGSVRFGGIQWATNFATQPQLITYPMPGVTGEALLPSTVDVYVDNALRSSSQVPAGPFALTDLPLITGQGDMRVVVRDLLGREQIITQPYYMSTQLLNVGLSAYNYEAGFIRRNYSQESFDYRRGFMAGTYRYGLTDRLTGEAHGEVLAEQQTIGLSGTYLWPELGEASLSLAGSHTDYGADSLLALGLRRQTRRLNFSARTQLASPHFTHLGTIDGKEAPRALSYVSVGSSFNRYGSASLGYIHQDNRDTADVNMLNVYYNLSLGNIGSLNFGYIHFLNGSSGDSFGLTFSTSLGERTSANAQTTYQNDKQRLNLGVQQSLPRGDGYGYRLSADAGNDDQERLNGSVAMQNNVGRYELEVTHQNAQTATRGSVRGGIAFMDGDAHFSRYLADSFALVQVPESPNVHVYADNQPVGVTDSDGNLLVTQLRPYQRNKIRIDPSEFPFEAQLADTNLEAVPYYRSGYKLAFAVKYARSATLNVLLTDGSPLPAGALIQILGQPEQFPVATKGEVYLTGLATHNRLRATWNKQACEFPVEFPPTSDPQPNLGTFTCQQFGP